MQIQTVKSKAYEISHKQRVLAMVSFGSIWKMKAQAKFGAHQLTITPSESNWRGEYEAKLNDTHRSDIEMDLQGKSSIKINSPKWNAPKVFNIDKESEWRFDYIITDAQKVQYLRLKGKWHWLKLNYSYTVESVNKLDKALLVELLIYATFIQKVHLQQAAAV